MLPFWVVVLFFRLFPLGLPPHPTPSIFLLSYANPLHIASFLLSKITLTHLHPLHPACTSSLLSCTVSCFGWLTPRIKNHPPSLQYLCSSQLHRYTTLKKYLLPFLIFFFIFVTFKGFRSLKSDQSENKTAEEENR